LVLVAQGEQSTDVNTLATLRMMQAAIADQSEDADAASLALQAALALVTRYGLPRLLIDELNPRTAARLQALVDRREDRRETANGVGRDAFGAEREMALACLARYAEGMGNRGSSQAVLQAMSLSSTGVHLPAAGGVGPRPSRAAADVAGLSAKELEVMGLLSRAFSNKSIAKALNISPGTVKWHLKSIYSKLDAVSREDAVIRARGRHIVA
jgi:ATP/maltotriose-dependent transcriptional regulator MalT